MSTELIEELPQETQTEEEKQKEDALKERVKLLQEKIKGYITDLLSTDFTVEEAGYSIDLFKSWLLIMTHGTKQYEESLRLSKEANDKYLATKLNDLISVREEYVEKTTEETAA